MSQSAKFFEDNARRSNRLTEPYQCNESNGMALFIKEMEYKFQKLQAENEEIKQMLRYLIDKK